MFRFVCSATVLLLLCNLTPFLFQMELPSSNFPEKVYKHLKSEILQQIKDNLNIISRNQNKLYLTIEHLLYLSENEIISPDQSKIIWEYLSKNSNYEQSSEKPSIKTPDPAKINITIKPIISKPNNDIKNINSLSVIGGVILEYKTKLNFNQIIMITTLGIITFGFIFFLIFLALYRTERYGLMIFLLSFLLYNVLSLARNLQFQLGSYFMSGALLNVSFLLFNAIVHVSLIKLNMQKKVGKIKEIFNCEHHFSGKIIQTFMNLIFFFFALFFFHSQLAQLPFYVSFYSFIYLLSRKYESKLNKIFWPAWILFFSFFSILIIIFFYGTGRKNFIFIDPEELAQSLFLGDSQDIELNPDLQCFGLVFSCLILNILFPIYLYFQQNKVWKNYKAKEFSFYSIYKAIKSELNQEKLNLDINLVYHHVYAFVAFSLIYVGLRMKLSLMVLISSFSFQSYLCFIIKDGNLLWRIIFYVGSFCISNSLFLIGNMEDKFAKELMGDLKEGHLAYYLVLASKAILIYYSIEASSSLYSIKEEINNSSNNSDNENDDELEQEDENTEELEVFSRIFFSIFKFMMNYFFTVYLIVLAEEETSYLISFLFMLFALISFSKLLIYHSLTKHETNRNLISVCVYFGGLRLASLPGKMHSPLYLGFILSNLSVFASYISFKNLLFMVLSFLMLFGLFIQAYIMESSFGMLMALVNFSLLFSFLASKNASTIVYNFLLVIGIILTIFILNGFSLSFYFKLVEYVIDQVIPNSTLNYFKLIKGTELAEQALARQVLKVCMEYFLKND